ncbi:MAG TPA: hypothetical protein VF221_22140 [Chloroflexota bacterium]
MTTDEPESSRKLTDHEVVSDLKASVGARRELGPEMEDEVLEAFLARVEERLGVRAAERSGSKPVAKSKRSEIESPVTVVGASLILSIPSLAIAGDVAGSLGLVLVVVALIAIDTLYFIDRWVRMG